MQRLLLSSSAIALFFLTGCPHSAVDVGELDPVSLGGSDGSAPGAGGSPIGGVWGEGGATLGAGGQAGAIGGVWGEGGATLGAGGQAGAIGGAIGVGGAGGMPPLPGELGASCNVSTEAGAPQGVFNAAADDCASRICLKPVSQVGSTDTSPLCTKGCATDADCEGQLRDLSDPTDRRCKSGFTCGVAFVKGAICCRNLCICQDFTGGPITTVPIACQGDGALSCMN